LKNENSSAVKNNSLLSPVDQQIKNILPLPPVSPIQQIIYQPRLQIRFNLIKCPKT
jgi:hypothetical protein